MFLTWGRFVRRFALAKHARSGGVATNVGGREVGQADDGVTFAALAKVPRRREPGRSQLGAAIADGVGKAWNAPNTTLGVIYGGLGYAAGLVRHALNKDSAAPEVRWRDNALVFTNSPFADGAVTIGNATIYGDDPYDPTNHTWDARAAIEGHSVQEHERQHTIQGQQLGPLYLPSNLLGGLNAMLRGQDWHGDANWNERGPQANPARPWASPR
jgi:hypothetical protein